MFAFGNHVLLFEDLFITFLFEGEPPMDSLDRFGAGGDYKLGRQESFNVCEGVIGLMMKFYGIVDTTVQSCGYDMVEDLGVSGGLNF